MSWHKVGSVGVVPGADPVGTAPWVGARHDPYVPNGSLGRRQARPLRNQLAPWVGARHDPYVPNGSLGRRQARPLRPQRLPGSALGTTPTSPMARHDPYAPNSITIRDDSYITTQEFTISLVQQSPPSLAEISFVPLSVL
jgi:hypothetical protein